MIQRAARDDGLAAAALAAPRDTAAAIARGRGIAYIHYKHNETYVAMGMEVAVERATGKIRVTPGRAARTIAGSMINPDGVRAQVEGNILQTLSRTLHEEIIFDRSRVTSVDWASYPILRFPEVPRLEIELIDRRTSRRSAPAKRPRSPVPAALGQRRVRRHRRPAAHRSLRRSRVKALLG